jgi:uncharacterized protein
MKKTITLFFLVFLCNSLLGQIEKQLPARPQPPRLVTDYTGTLSADQQDALERKLVAFDDSTSSQIAVVIIESTGDYDIADFAFALGRSWGIGNKEFNNGVLLLVAKQDRKMFIATGYGLEGALPDATAKQIISNEIRPNFKGNDYYRGLDQGTDAIINAVKGEYIAPENHNNENDKDGIPGIFIIILVFIIIGFLNRRGGGGSGGRGFRRGGGFMYFPTGGSSHWGGSSGGSSGGFGGFGGGSFGGGGAGGDW